MNENLNLVELLKDCPVGTKFYSSYLGKDVFFKGIQDNYIECEYHSTIDSPFNSTIQFRKEGSFFKDGECMIFPSKDQRDWNKWHRPFKDGDILAFTFGRKPTIYIYRENGTHNTSYYAAYSSENNKFYGDGTGALASNRDDLRFATENEKKKLFDVLRENGYQWNPETKTLEKLIVPKFKVGDRIRHKLTGNVHKVLFVLSNGYDGGVYDVAITNEIGKSIDIKEQDYYELVPSKFDPKTLQPFDRVIVRDFDNQKWMACLFSHIENGAYHKFKTSSGLGWHQCIPFNNDTKHLVGKMDKASEFYKYWEE